MKIRIRELLLLSPLLLTACAYSVHDVYVSGFEAKAPLSSSKAVSSHAEQFVVLGFKTETDYMDRAYSDLQNLCPQGEIIGVVTEFQTAMGFFSWHNHVYMKGLCVASASAAVEPSEQGPAAPVLKPKAKKKS